MEDVVNFETAKLLKKVGFNFSIYKFYVQDNSKSKPYLTTSSDYDDSDRDCKWDWNLNGGESGFQSKIIPYPNDSNLIYTSAPTQSLAQKFLREKHDIHISIRLNKKAYKYQIQYVPESNEYGKYLNESKNYDSYEKCLEQALLESLQMI